MKNLKKISVFGLSLLIFVLPVFVLAQAANSGSNPTPQNSGSNPAPAESVDISIGNPTNAGSTLMEVLYSILNNVVMPIAAIAVVMWIIYAGFTYLTAQGNPKKVEEAHQRLLWSLVGAGILLGAAGISKVVENTIQSLLN